jgi:hypothetical protein
VKNDVSPTMVVQLSAMPDATGRPEEVLAAMDIDPVDVEVARTALYFDDNHD